MEGNCKCYHHSATKAMLYLAGLAALGFWWATAFKTNLMWMDGEHLFKDTVILSLLVLISRYCDCCGTGSSHTCKHGENCNM